jgi:hypothetical protein
VLADLLAITGGQHRWRSVLRGIGVLARIVIQDRARRLTLVIDGVPHAEEVFSVTVANSFFIVSLPFEPG